MSIKYTVRSGDTLSSIAKRYNTTINDIRNANLSLIKNVNLIKTGWVLTIPNGGGSTPPVTQKPAEVIKDSELKEALTTCLNDIENLPSFKRFLKVL